MTGVMRAYAEVDGRQLHYRRAGDPALPVVLLLHQAPSHSAMYEPLMERLGDRFCLIAPDTPGFGNSDALEGECDIEAFAGCFASLLQCLEIEKCLVFGHHTGAAIAVQLASGFPGLCSALALSGPTLLSEDMRQTLPQLASPFPVEEEGGHLLKMWQRIRDKDQNAPLELIQREVLSAIASGNNYQGSYRAVCRQDFAAGLQTLQCPVLVFAGDEDALRGSVTPSLDLLRDGHTTELEPGAGTYACERRADEIARILVEFFNSTCETAE